MAKPAVRNVSATAVFRHRTGSIPAPGAVFAPVFALLAGFAMTGCQKPETPVPAVQTAAPPVDTDPVQIVSRFLTGLSPTDPNSLAAIDVDHFIQHDPSIANGLAGYKEYLASVPADALKTRPVRLFRDGNLVVAHSVVGTSPPSAEFDVFRVDHDKIVEHWQNIQLDAAGPNASGHTMIDGPTAVADDADTDANKATARKFITDVIVGEKLDGFDAYFDADHYIQHYTGGTDGASALKGTIAALAAANTPIGYSKVERVIGQGNFVLVMSSGLLADKPMAFYDLFRFDKGKLAEHWAVIQEIPARELWKNTNGKF